MPYTVVCNCQNSLNGMLKLKFIRFPVFRLCLRKRERGGKRRGERGQEKEDNHKTQTELVNAIHAGVFKGGVKRAGTVLRNVHGF